MTTRTISFRAASPTPANGYRLRYRLQGSSDAYITLTSTTSPFTVTNLTEGVSYEYLLDSNCGSGNFSTPTSGTFNTYPTITGTIDAVAGSVSNSNVTLSVNFTNPTPIDFHFRWGFCWKATDNTMVDSCEQDTSNHTDWPLVTVTANSNSKITLNQTGIWNSSHGYVNSVTFWDLSNNVILNLIPLRYSQFQGMTFNIV